MVFRKALLVCANDCAYRSDSDQGIEMTRNFLMSPRGGAWSESEIVTLKNPAVTELLDAAKKNDADYSVLFFYGRSFEDPNGRRFLIVGDGDFFEDRELLNGSSRQLVVIDTSPAPQPVPEEKEIFQFEGGPAEISHARMMYDRWIETSSPGKLILHGNIVSPEKREGLFTRKLLQVAQNLPAVENKFNLKSIIAAGIEAPALMSEEETNLPCISFESGNISLPFALAMPKLVKNSASSSSDSGFSGLAMAVFILGLLFSAD
jgi:hypothetical protein